jgi:hypothetical protein
MVLESVKKKCYNGAVMGCDSVMCVMMMYYDICVGVMMGVIWVVIVL